MSLDLTEATRQVAHEFESVGATYLDHSHGDYLARTAVAVAAPIIERQVLDQMRGANDLVATLVQANVDAAAWTTEQLLEYEKANAVKLAAALLALDTAIEASQFVDRRVLQAQDRLGPVLDLAEHYVAKEGA